MSPSPDSPNASTAASETSASEARGLRSNHPGEPQAPDVPVSSPRAVNESTLEGPPSGIGLWWPIVGKGVAIGLGAIVLAAIGNFSPSDASGFLRSASLSGSLTPTLGAPATTEWLAPAPEPPQPNNEVPPAASSPLVSPKRAQPPTTVLGEALAGPSRGNHTGTVEVNVGESGDSQSRDSAQRAFQTQSADGPLRPSGSEEESTSSSPENTTGLTTDGRVILNRANVQELTLLPGIGQKRATKIVELREHLGGFKRISDLLRVRGIGNKSLRKLMPHLVLNPPP